MENKKLRTALFLHIVLVVLEMIDTNYAYGKRGLGMLIHYTEDSNLLCLIVSALFTLVMLPIIFKGQTNGFVSTFLMRNYKKDETKQVTIPAWLLLARYVTTCCLLVTFIVVLVVLGPEDGYHAMLFEGTHLINHVGAPLLSLYLFLGLETEPQQKLPSWAPIAAVLTTVAYAIPVLVLNITKLYVGPYSFFHVYEQPLWKTMFWLVVILGGNYVIARLVQMIYNRRTRK